jgi:holo-[acyl-carrier protein] synthase
MDAIKGIGIDIVSISRISKIYELYKDRFINKIFTRSEINESIKKGHFISSIAGKFAAKEAFLKAYSPPYFSFKQIEILSSKNNKPNIRILNDKSTKVIKNCYLSISHEHEMAIAVVIIIK